MAGENLVAKIVIGGSTAGAQAAIRELTGALRTGLLGALAAAGAALATFTLTQTAAISADERRARSLGLTTTALRDLREGAADAKVEAGTLDSALESLAKRIVAAAGGSRESVAIFRALGVSFVDSAGKARPLMEVLRDVADRLRGFRDGIEKTQLVKELFGSADTRLIDFLNRGGEGLSKFSGMTEDLAANAVKLQAEVDKLSISAERFKNVVLSELLPPVNELIDRFKQAKEAGAGWFSAFSIAISGRLGASLKEQEKEITKIIDLVSKNPLLSGTNIGGALLDSMISRLNAVRKLIAVEEATAGASGLDREFILRGRSKPAAPVIDRTRPTRERDDSARLQAEIAERVSALGAEATATNQLTEAQKFALKVLTDIREGKVKLTDAEKRARTEQLEQLLVLDREITVRRQLRDFEDAAAANRQSILGAAQRELAADQESLRTKGLLRSEIVALEEARLRDALAQQIAAGESEDELATTRQLIALAGQRRVLFADDEARQRRFETGWFDAIRSFVAGATDGAQQAGRLFDTFVRGAEDAFAEFARTGRLSFRNLLAGLADDLARSGFRQLLAQLFGEIGGGAGSSGFFDFLGNAFIKIFGMHSGGIAGRDGFRREVPALAFALAPRFHAGGVVRSGEVPAILQEGERVLTADQQKSLGSGGISVNVAVNGAEASAADQRAAGNDLARVVEGVVAAWAVRQQRPGGILYRAA